MKHVILGANYGYGGHEIDADHKRHAKSVIARMIAEELLKGGLIEFDEDGMNDPYETRLKGEVVAIKLSDYEKLMKYVYSIKGYAFYDEANDEHIQLGDLL